MSDMTEGMCWSESRISRFAYLLPDTNSDTTLNWMDSILLPVPIVPYLTQFRQCLSQVELKISKSASWLCLKRLSATARPIGGLSMAQHPLHILALRNHNQLLRALGLGIVIVNPK